MLAPTISTRLLTCLIHGGQGLLEHLGEVDVVLLGEGVEPSGNGEVFPDRLVAIPFGIGVHIECKQADEAAIVRHNAFQWA